MINLRDPFQAIRREGARALLALAGVVIGVFAVISTVVIGSGVTSAVGEELGAISDRSFVVYVDAADSKSLFPELTLEQIHGARDLPGLAAFIPVGNFGGTAQLRGKAFRVSYGAEAADPLIQEPVASGRRLTMTDIQDSSHVAVLSSTGAQEMAVAMPRVGEEIMLSGVPFKIVGILRREHASRIPDLAPLADIYVPYSTYETTFLQGRTILAARGLARDPSRLDETMRATIKYLEKSSNYQNEYMTASKRQYQATLNGISTAVTLTASIIASVSAVIAGIGIFTTMLISVSARRLEIGLRRAVGATRNAILLQFLAEAFIVSAVGSVFGTILGLSLGAAVGHFVIAALTGITPSIPWAYAAGAASASAIALTLVFGLLPAMRAARTEPIEALRWS